MTTITAAPRAFVMVSQCKGRQVDVARGPVLFISSQGLLVTEFLPHGPLVCHW